MLDDSARVAVRDLAWEYGFRYLTRPNRGYLKTAGNLRFGYQNSSGDFIAIFDADFVTRWLAVNPQRERFMVVSRWVRRGRRARRFVVDVSLRRAAWVP